MMRYVGLVCTLFLLFDGSPAAAQTQIQLSTSVVSPGQSVGVTVTGTSNHVYVVIGSSVNGGFTYAGVPLGVGQDVVILAAGSLGSSGTTVVSVTPPFNGTILDRYYLQAVTSPSPNYAPPLPSPSAVVRNADLVAGLNGPPGPQGPPGLSGITTMEQMGSVPANSTNGSLTVVCPDGTRVIGGGAGGNSTDLRMYASRPQGNGWFGVFLRDQASPTSAAFRVYAICAVVGS